MGRALGIASMDGSRAVLLAILAKPASLFLFPFPPPGRKAFVSIENVGFVCSPPARTNSFEILISDRKKQRD